MRSHIQYPPEHDSAAEGQHRAQPNVPSAPHLLLHLQRTLGNRAVMRMLGKGWVPAQIKPPPKTHTLPIASTGLLIQREWVKKSLNIDEQVLKGYWNQERTAAKAEFYVPSEENQYGTIYKWDKDTKTWYYFDMLFAEKHLVKMEQILGKQEIEAPREEKQGGGLQLPSKTITHIFDGEANRDGNGHVGLHSNLRLGGKTDTFEIIHPPDGNGVYSVLVKLKTFDNEKGSFFFPDNWDEEKIKTEILYAWQRKTVMRGGAVHWHGPSTVEGLLIGGLGGTQSLDDLITAFPSYLGEFHHPDSIDRTRKGEYKRRLKEEV